MIEQPKNSPQSATSDNGKGQQLELSKEIEDKLIAKVLRDYQSADSSRKAWTTKKYETLKLYWGMLAPKSFPFKNCANLNVPLMRTLKETLHANLMGSFNDRIPFDVIPVGPEGIMKAQRVRKFLNWQFLNEINYYKLLDTLLDHALVYGHAVGKIRYIQEQKIVKQKDQSGQVVEKVDTEFDGIKIDVVNPEDFLFPSNAMTDDVQKLDFVMHEIPMTTSDIRRRMASGQYRGVEIPEPTYGAYNASNTDFKYIRDSYIGTSHVEHSNRGGFDEAKSHRVVEWYGFFDVDEDGIEESVMVTVLLDKRSVLRAVVWPISRPFVIVRWSPIFNTPFGESIADMVGKINEELNTLHNQRVDAVTLANVPYGFYDPLSGFDPEKIELTPGLMLPTNGDPSHAVYFPTMQPIRPEMYREEELLMSYAERLVGAGANAQGAINPKRMSATEVSTVDRRSGIRFLSIFKRIQDGLETIARIVLEYNQLFMPPKKQVRVMGANDYPVFASKVSFENFQKEELQGKFDFVAVGASIMDDEANKAEQMQVYQLGMSNPLIIHDPMAIYNLTKDTLVAMGRVNWASYLPKPQVMSPMDPELENDKMASGESVDPVQGENIALHLKKHAEFINSPQFKMVPQEAQMEVVIHYQKTMKLQQLEMQMKQLEAQQQEMQKQQMMMDQLKMIKAEDDIETQNNIREEIVKGKIDLEIEKAKPKPVVRSNGSK